MLTISTQATVEWVINEMEQWAPPCWAEDFDNVGLLVGDKTQPVKKILVALDATDAVVAEAVAGSYDCIITHHALIFAPLKQIVASDDTGRRILKLAKHGISLYTAHTNLDKAPGGVNDCLAKKLGMDNAAPMVPDPLIKGIGLGLVAQLPVETTLGKLAAHVKASLKLESVRYSGSLSAKIKKAALCGGSGMSFWQHAKDADCHVYITGDIKYSDALGALAAGLCLLDITHYSGENIVVEAIVERLRTKAQQAGIPLEISPTTVNGQTFYTV